MIPRRPPRRRAPYAINVLLLIGLVAVLLIVYLLAGRITSKTNSNSAQQVAKGPDFKADAIQRAQQAVREQLGDSLRLSFDPRADVEITDSTTYNVRSTAYTMDRSGIEYPRSWIVTLELQADTSNKDRRWKVASCYIGQ